MYHTHLIHEVVCAHLYLSITSVCSRTHKCTATLVWVTRVFILTYVLVTVCYLKREHTLQGQVVSAESP